MILDLHLHSELSDDSRAPVEAYLKLLQRKRRERPLDGIVLTEHRQFDPGRDYRALEDRYGFLVLTAAELAVLGEHDAVDRKSTRLNSSHQIIPYAVFCLKKKNRFLAAASARLDREPLGISPSNLLPHLPSCPDCARWTSPAERATRLMRLDLPPVPHRAARGGRCQPVAGAPRASGTRTAATRTCGPWREATPLFAASACRLCDVRVLPRLSA